MHNYFHREVSLSTSIDVSPGDCAFPNAPSGCRHREPKLLDLHKSLASAFWASRLLGEERQRHGQKGEKGTKKSAGSRPLVPSQSLRHPNCNNHHKGSFLGTSMCPRTQKSRALSKFVINMFTRTPLQASVQMHVGISSHGHGPCGVRPAFTTFFGSK